MAPSIVIVILLLLTVALDALVSPPLGFVEVGGMPYLAMLVLAARLGSGRLAVLAGAATLALLLGLGQAAGRLRPDLIGPFNPGDYSPGQRLALAIGALAAAVIIRDRGRVEERLAASEARAREARSELSAIQREAAAMETSIRDLYNRHAVESRTITALGEELDRFQSLDRQTVLNAAMRATRLLTGAETVVVYQVEEASLQLRRVALWPEQEDPNYPQSLDIGDSIEGWVVRTGSAFTLRQTMDDPALGALDTERTIIAAPIRTRGHIWGVLTIGALPFTAYNQGSEVALDLVAVLAGGGIDQSFGSAVSSGEEEQGDEPGAGPLRQADELRDDLERLGRSGSASLFLVELRGPLARPLSISEDRQQQLVEQVATRLTELTTGAARCYSYQFANQFALLGANLNYDAAPYFLLRILETVSGQAWSVGADTLLPEAVVGFATSRDGEPDAMLRRAESMLLLQTDTLGEPDGRT